MFSDLPVMNLPALPQANMEPQIPQKSLSKVLYSKWGRAHL